MAIDDYCRICRRKNTRNDFADIFIRKFNMDFDAVTLQTAMQQLTGTEIIQDDSISSYLCRLCKTKVHQAHKLRLDIIRSQKSIKTATVAVVTKPQIEVYKIIGLQDDNGEQVEFITTDPGQDLNDVKFEEIEITAENIENETETEILTIDAMEDDPIETIKEMPAATNGKSSKKSPHSKITTITESDAKDSNDAVSFLLENDHLFPNPRTKDKENRPHECKVCSKSFMRKSNLVDHLRLHANVRLFKCNYCDKSFVQAGNYRSHLRIHTKERPYKCSLCSKTYNQSSALKVHIRSHTNERNYICDVCDKAFTNSSDLSKHKRVHDPSKKVKCEYCEKTFAQKINMKNHIIRHHSGKQSKTETDTDE